eukprot:TRINITY_DN2017_c0_g1_i1.p2 TRINITY_DN2017_c0_g1~~TRINITY_DN2017_c0_g1_i1.p2  ORF type:complete len:401 (+),score=95.55 TRINITY_DN2017_c0_g1_i1:380-1582(+)
MGIVTMDGKGILFIPKLDPAYQVIMGEIEQPIAYKERFELHEVHFIEDLPKVMESLHPATIHVVSGFNADSGIEYKPATFPGIEKFKVNPELLLNQLFECRLVKTDEEIKVMKYVVEATAKAHMQVAKTVRPGMMEYQLEATFLHHIYFESGCRQPSFTPICGSGPNSAILHYGHAGKPNNRQIQDGELVLVDMGAEYHCYDGDLTTTIPANGKFTEKQKAVYETVLAANRAVIAAMKPGVDWKEMHALSNVVICEGMKKLGLVKGDIAEMQKVHIGALFMPHGLGHCLGLDTHDVGGYEQGVKRIQAPGYKRLRCGRVLKKGMIMTVEPGIYFNHFVFEPAFADPEMSKFLCPEEIKKYYGFGGIRIEDDVLVTESGREVLSAMLPRTVAEIEAFMKHH